MAKYIDADKLKAEIERRYAEYLAKMKTDDFTYYEGMADALDLFEQYIDSLQQEQPEDVLIPKWCLENIENTLRIQHNINNDAKDSETCQDRNIKESLNCVRKLLNGEEITGRERSEPLMKQPEADLEEEMVLYSEKHFDYNSEWDTLNPKAGGYFGPIEFDDIARHFFELGQQEMRKRLSNPEYNKEVIERMKSEYPDSKEESK